MYNLQITDDEFRLLNRIVVSKYDRCKSRVEAVEGFGLDTLNVMAFYRRDTAELAVLTSIRNKLVEILIEREQAAAGEDKTNE